jgi:hypothetical protein
MLGNASINSPNSSDFFHFCFLVVEIEIHEGFNKILSNERLRRGTFHFDKTKTINKEGRIKIKTGMITVELRHNEFYRAIGAIRHSIEA